MCHKLSKSLNKKHTNQQATLPMYSSNSNPSNEIQECKNELVSTEELMVVLYNNYNYMIHICLYILRIYILSIIKDR